MADNTLTTNLISADVTLNRAFTLSAINRDPIAIAVPYTYGIQQPNIIALRLKNTQSTSFKVTAIFGLKIASS